MVDAEEALELLPMVGTAATDTEEEPEEVEALPVTDSQVERVEQAHPDTAASSQ